MNPSIEAEKFPTIEIRQEQVGKSRYDIITTAFALLAWCLPCRGSGAYARSNIDLVN